MAPWRRNIQTGRSISSSTTCPAAVLPEIVSRHGWSICYRPIDLPEVKRAAGNIGPSTHFLPARKRYIQQDTARRAKRYGVPIAQPANFDSARLNRAPSSRSLAAPPGRDHASRMMLSD